MLYVLYFMAGCNTIGAKDCMFAKVGFRKYQSSNLAQKLIESTNVQFSITAPLLQNRW
jgi:hypothetical protein